MNRLVVAPASRRCEPEHTGETPVPLRSRSAWQRGEEDGERELRQLAAGGRTRDAWRNPTRV